jgi:hypothetical protein
MKNFNEEYLVGKIADEKIYRLKFIDGIYIYMPSKEYDELDSNTFPCKYSEIIWFEIGERIS